MMQRPLVQMRSIIHRIMIFVQKYLDYIITTRVAIYVVGLGSVSVARRNLTFSVET